MQSKTSNYEIYANDPRLRMTIAGRLLVRAFSYIGYTVLAAATVTFLISNIAWLRVLGIFFVLFFIDTIVHLGQADKPLTELPKEGRVDVLRYVTPKAFTVVEHAFDKSSITKKNIYLPIILELLHFSHVRDGLVRLDVSVDEFQSKVEDFLKDDQGNLGKSDLITALESLFVLAFQQAIDSGSRFIGPVDLFSALSFVDDAHVKRLLDLFSIEAGDLERTLIFSIAKSQFSRFRRVPANVGSFIFESHRGIRHRIMNRAWTARPTPTLDKYGADLTDLARRGQAGFLIGHATEMQRLIDTLARPINPNALLIGEAGIGKETLVSHLALLLAKDEVPEVLFDKRLVSLELPALVSGASPDELQLRIKTIVSEVILAGNVILYLPDIHNLMNTSGTAYLSAADALMPIITNNAFPVIGATYPKEFKQLIEPRSDFLAAFEVIRVEEISEADAEKILIYESLILENQFKTVVSFGAIKTAVHLAKKYFRTKFLPSSAEELLKSALVESSRKGEKSLGPDEVIRAAEGKSNIPMHEAEGAEAEKLLHLEETIHERLIDQEEAVKGVADALREYRSGLSRKGGPIATFLFVGPTGVGKTELAKILAKIQFGSENLMVRFDMTEYQDKQSFYRFIGSPDGKVSGTLTGAIIQKPYSLILLDEFEKAFPDILDLFLQVFDDGRLTDNLGRVVDFQNTIIIATSNAHSDIINQALNQGEAMTGIAEYLKKKLTDVFKPELINRFSKIVIFKELSPADLEKVVVLSLKELASQISEQGINLSFDASVVKKFAQIGYDPAFGARPLRRVIDEKLRSILAQKILAKEISHGDQFLVTFSGENLEFLPQK